MGFKCGIIGLSGSGRPKVDAKVDGHESIAAVTTAAENPCFPNEEVAP
jgi:hypothetical protein